MYNTEKYIFSILKTISSKSIFCFLLYKVSKARIILVILFSKKKAMMRENPLHFTQGLPLLNPSILDSFFPSSTLWGKRVCEATQQALENPFDPFWLAKLNTRIVLAHCTFSEDIRKSLDEAGVQNPFSELIHAMINWTKGMSESGIIGLQDPHNDYNRQLALKEASLTQLGFAWEFSTFLRSKIWDNSFSDYIDAHTKSLNIFLAHREKPEWKMSIKSQWEDWKEIPIEPEVVMKQDFCDVLKFENPNLPSNAPRVVLVAPMSGHYATLLRGTVKELLKTNHVYITDWKDARSVPKEVEFWTDEFTTHLIEMMQELKKQGVNSITAVCQPCPWVMTALAYCEANTLERPDYVILMAWPIDVSQNPTAVNKYADTMNIDTLGEKVISSVPEYTNGRQNIGFERAVYPWWLQLMSFMWMNSDRHLSQLRSLREAFLAWEDTQVEKDVLFYDEYMSVMDLTAKFFLETNERIFIKNESATWKVMYQWDIVNFSEYSWNILAIEWELDDICGLWQTKAVLELAKWANTKVYHMLQLAGHYGVFDGSMYRYFIAPRINAFIRWEDMGNFQDSPEAIAYLERKIVMKESSVWKEKLAA